jgi:pentatricopeptide repeat protein
MKNKIISTSFLLLFTVFAFAQDAAMEEGIKWKEKGNLVEAIKYFEKALEVSPSDINISKEYANAAYQLRKYVKALPTYETILEQEPKNITVLTRLAKMYSYSSQKFKSVEYAERAVKLKPTDPTQQIELGDAFYFVKHYPKAIEQYKKVSPATDFTIHRIAKSYEKISAFHSAAENYDKLIKRKNGTAKATLYYEYGNALFNNNQFKLATRAYLTAKEKGFYNSKLINENIALGFFAIKAYEPALEHYLEAKKSAPYDKNLNLDIADCYVRMGQFKKARVLIEEMQKTNPNDGDLMYAYGMTFYKEGKTSKAENFFNKAFVMKPSLKGLRYTKSRF